MRSCCNNAGNLCEQIIIARFNLDSFIAKDVKTFNKLNKKCIKFRILLHRLPMKLPQDENCVSYLLFGYDEKMASVPQVDIKTNNCTRQS